MTEITYPQHIIIVKPQPVPRSVAVRHPFEAASCGQRGTSACGQTRLPSRDRHFGGFSDRQYVRQ